MYLKIHNIKIIDRLKLTITLKEYEEYEYERILINYRKILVSL